MAQVNATIAGRQYRLACEDGQEDHLLALSRARQVLTFFSRS